jgi:hypothetical protein
VGYGTVGLGQPTVSMPCVPEGIAWAVTKLMNGAWR